jgi:hypothetical protein
LCSATPPLLTEILHFRIFLWLFTTISLLEQCVTHTKCYSNNSSLHFFGSH